ncbi:MAG: cytochrome c maturation protein CcmE [Chloroflexi bacterium]|nr:cytochrome c maturation protein CcmE [Chloroflexota bacterium]
MEFRRKTVVIVGVVLVLAMSFLLFGHLHYLRNIPPHYSSVSTLLAKGSAVYGRTIEVDGRVKADSIEEDAPNQHYEFDIYDVDGNGELAVVYDGSVGDGFEENREIRITGTMDADGLVATRIRYRISSHTHE